MSKHKIVCGAAALALMLGAVPVHASSFSDALSKCLVDRTTEKDKTMLIQWVFSSLSAGPAVKSMSTVTPAQRTEFSRSAAQLMSRLLTVDCRSEAVTAIKFDGPEVVKTSFGVLGQVAMRGMMSHPDVNAQLEQLSTFVDTTALEALFKDAGLPAPKPSAK